MKLTARDAAAYLKAPDKQHRALLLYGPDAGLIGERAKLASKAVVPDTSDPFAVKELTEAQIKDDPAILIDELCAYSLMGGKRLVILRDAGDKSTKIIEAALGMPAAQAFLLVLADELGARSTLRVLFEKHPQAAALACYKDEERDIASLIQETFRTHGVQHDRDVVPYLTRSLGNDRRVTLNEIDKILLYLGTEKHLTLEMVSELVASNQDTGIDDICMAVAGGETGKLDRMLEALFRENTQPVAILRTVQGYFQRLYWAQGKLAAGESPERLVMQMRPPIFYKHQPAFHRHLKLWSAKRIAMALQFLLQAEIAIKTASAPPPLLCANALNRLAMKVAA